MSKKSGYVYIIQYGDTDIYKIGKTSCKPIQRLRSLQTGTPIELKLYEVFFVSDVDACEGEAQEFVKANRV